MRTSHKFSRLVSHGGAAGASMGLLISLVIAMPCVAQELDFPDGTVFYAGDAGSRIEYCPDNTCDVFSALGRHQLRNLQRFAFLYLFAVSTFYKLDTFRTETNREIFGRLLREVARGCGNSTLVKEQAVCALRAMQREHGIEVFGARYDEGRRHKFPVEEGVLRYSQHER